jgi:hypothetical protein
MAVFFAVAPYTQLVKATALMMEAASAYEMSMNFYHITRRYSPEESIYTRLCENLKSRFYVFFVNGVTSHKLRKEFGLKD